MCDFFYQHSGTLSRASFLGLKRYLRWIYIHICICIYTYIYAYMRIGLEILAALFTFHICSAPIVFVSGAYHHHHRCVECVSSFSSAGPLTSPSAAAVRIASHMVPKGKGGKGKGKNKCGTRGHGIGWFDGLMPCFFKQIIWVGDPHLTLVGLGKKRPWWRFDPVIEGLKAIGKRTTYGNASCLVTLGRTHNMWGYKKVQGT